MSEDCLLIRLCLKALCVCESCDHDLNQDHIQIQTQTGLDNHVHHLVLDMRNQTCATCTGILYKHRILLVFCSFQFFLVSFLFLKPDIMCVQEAARAYAPAIWLGQGRERGTGSDSREQRPHFQNIFLARLFSDEISMFSFRWQLPSMRCIVSPSPIRPRTLLK